MTCYFEINRQHPLHVIRCIHSVLSILIRKLRAKLQSACHPVFEELMDDKFGNKSYRFNKHDNADPNTDPDTDRVDMEPFLKSTNIQNIHAEPLRDMKTMKTLIVIALLDQQYETAFKWITVQIYYFFFIFSFCRTC